MIRIFSLFAAALLVSVQLHAQLGVGLRGGVLISSQETDSEEFVDESVTGYMVGIPIEIGISNMFSLQPEFNYERRGTDRSFGVLGTQEVRLNYLDIPLLLKLGYTSDRFTLAGLVGPSVSVGLGGTVTNKFTTGESEVDIEFGDGGMKRTEIGGVLGAQLGFPIGEGKFIIDGRYRVGFTNLNDNNDNNNTDFNTTSRGYSGTIGYMWTIGEY